MKNLKLYNTFIESLDRLAQGGLLFHRIEQCIYITDFAHRLLGVWDLEYGQPKSLS